jgi:PAS domain S-box-containing protein
MAIEWSLPVASFIGDECIAKVAGAEPSVIFTSYGPNNGVHDAHFNDRYGYLTRVNSKGKVLFNKIAYIDYSSSPVLSLDEKGERFCLYQTIPSIDNEDTVNFPAEERKLIIINQGGGVIRSFPVATRPLDLWLDPYKGYAGKQIYSTWSDGKVRIFDTTLNLLAESNATDINSLLGVVRIQGQDRPVMVMASAGGVDLYRHDFKKLGRFDLPGNLLFQPLEYDGSGNVTRFILGGHNFAAIVGIHRRQFLEYAAIIFWEYHIPILFWLIGLSVAILILNYRRLGISRRLKESEELYRTLVEGAGEPIFSVSYDGKFLFMNDNAAGWLGGKATDFVGKNMWDLFPKEIAERQLESIRKVVKSRHGQTFENHTVLMGKTRYHRTNIQPIFDSNGNCNSVLAIAADITPLVEARTQAIKDRDFAQSLMTT